MAAVAGIRPRPEGGAVNLNLNPVIPVVAQIVSDMDLGGMLKTVLDCVDSSSLANVSLVTLKCYPIVERGDQLLVQRLDSQVSARIRYLEASVMGIASLVYNVVFGVIFGIVSLATLGQVRVVMDQMKKHWIHIGLAVASVGIAIAGTFSPKVGQKANIAAMLGIGALIGTLAQTDVVRRLTQAYQRHSPALRAAVLQGVQGDRSLFDREFAPFFDHLDHGLNDTVVTVYELAEVVQGVAAYFPQIVPIATPGLIFGSLSNS